MHELFNFALIIIQNWIT